MMFLFEAPGDYREGLYLQKQDSNESILPSSTQIMSSVGFYIGLYNKSLPERLLW